MTPQRATATGALEAHHELLAWWASRQGLAFFTGWRKARKADGYAVACETDVERRNLEYRTLQTAQTYLISDEMRELAEHAAKSMPKEPLLATDLPSPTGFMVFETPIALNDVNRKIVNIGAMSWSYHVAANVRMLTGEYSEVTTGIVMLTNYSDTTDLRDEYMKDLAEHNLRPPTHYIILGEGALRMSDSTDVEMLAQRFGVGKDVAEENVFYVETLPKALWTLMGQTLSVSEPQAADRAARRRLAKMGSPLADRKVRVVKLRRVSHKDPAAASGEAIEWSHRWMVSGHWRNQWLASVKRHRLQWIAPFIKGPDDKPLVVKDTVKYLSR